MDRHPNPPLSWAPAWLIKDKTLWKVQLCRQQWFSKGGCWTKSIFIPWEYVRNANSHAPPRPTERGTLGQDSTVYALKSPPGNSDAPTMWAPLAAADLCPSAGNWKAGICFRNPLTNVKSNREREFTLIFYSFHKLKQCSELSNWIRHHCSYSVKWIIVENIWCILYLVGSTYGMTRSCWLSDRALLNLWSF